MLRSDGAEIDPETSPVSIDDEGNVVGLSGLSELMRGSDEQANATPKRDKADRPQPKRSPRTKQAAEALPRDARNTNSPSPASAGSNEADSNPDHAIARKRARIAKQKRKRTSILIAVLSLGLVIGAGLVLLVLISLPSVDPSKPQDRPSNTPPNENEKLPAPDTRDNPPIPGTGTPHKTDNNIQPPRPAEQPHHDDADLKQAGQHHTHTNPNLDQTTEPTSPTPSPPTLPAHPPTVLEPASRVEQAAWHWLDPPRAPSKPATSDGVFLDDTMTPMPGPRGQVILSGVIQNHSQQAVEKARVHLMLIDAQGHVFAETYIPLIAVNSQSSRNVAVAVPELHWDRTNSIRAGVQVTDWSKGLSLVPDVMISSQGQGGEMTVRLSAKHQEDKAINHAMVRLQGLNLQGAEVVEFLLPYQAVDIIEPGNWFDVVIPTPVQPDMPINRWEAEVYAH